MQFNCSSGAVNYIKQFFFNIDKNKSCFIFHSLTLCICVRPKILYGNKLDGSLPKPSEIDVNNIIYVPVLYTDSSFMNGNSLKCLARDTRQSSFPHSIVYRYIGTTYGFRLVQTTIIILYLRWHCV